MNDLEELVDLLHDLDDEFDCNEIITIQDELDVIKHAVLFLLNREFHFNKSK